MLELKRKIDFPQIEAAFFLWTTPLDFSTEEQHRRSAAVLLPISARKQHFQRAAFRRP